MVKVVIDGKEYGGKKVVISGCKWEAFSRNGEMNFVDKEEPLLLVPKEIEFYKFDTLLGLKINEHILFFNEGSWAMNKFHTNEEYYFDWQPIQCKLVPCKREELKAGDWAVSQSQNTIIGTILCNYCLILDKEHYVCCSNKNNIKVDNDSYSYWWKVLPLTEEEKKQSMNNS